jgi:hypothetical protein
MKTLVQTLNKAEKSTEVFESPDGTRLLLLPHGARILGLYALGSDENFYWVSPKMEDSLAARGVFNGDGWQNTGGDRTWLTPELDIFFPDYPTAQRHWEPPQLDASEYEVSRNGQGVRLARRMTLSLARPGRAVELELTKSVGPAACPFRHESDMRETLSALKYAGYTQRTTLELLGDGERNPLALGIWNLIQLPHGGDLLVPTYYETRPLVLFGETPADKLSVSERLVRWSVNYPGEHKIALRATATTGRAGYLYRQGEEWALVVRNFFVNPSGEYVDVPKNDPADLGYSINAVNVDSALGNFCEMEYHAPAIEAGLGLARSEDVSQVWAFRGPCEAIRVVAQKLLGAEA